MGKMKFVDINSILKILILFGFSAFFVVTIMQGTVTKYVHPRMIPFMIAAAIVMCITAVLQFVELWKSHTGRKFNLSLLVYAVPLLTAFCFPAVSLDSSTVTAENFQFKTESSAEQTTPQGSAGQDTSSQNDNTTSQAVTESVGEKDSIVLDDENYYSYLYQIYENPKDYEGKKIELVGFVFKDETLAENEFVPARLVMVCCAADMVTSGFLCRYDHAAELVPDTWVKVTGTLQVDTMDGELSPYIEAIGIEPAEKPLQEYVYPY